MCTVVKMQVCVERVRTEMKERGKRKYLLLRYLLRVDAHVDENNNMESTTYLWFLISKGKTTYYLQILGS